MTLPGMDIGPLAGRLEDTLRAAPLPGKYADWGQRLLNRLRRPVQVTVAGLAGTGKSALIDMLLGRPVLGRGAACPGIEVCFGPKEEVFIELPDGQVLQHKGLLAGLELPENMVAVRQCLPDPALRGFTLAEVTLAEADAGRQEQVNKAAQSADVILWCSQSFSLAEQRIWAAVPDSVKDHSFLVLSMADQLIMRGTLAAQIADLEGAASEEFLGVYPVASIQGLTARTAGQAQPAGLWKSSGGKRLYDDVMRQIEAGRVSDTDQAEMLIQRFGGPEAEDSGGTGEKPEADPARPAGTALEDALDLLQRHASELSAAAEKTGAADPAAVLAGCMTAIRELSETLSQVSGGGAADALRDAAQEGEEMVMLFQLEQDEGAAADAATLLFQLRKEIAEATEG